MRQNKFKKGDIINNLIILDKEYFEIAKQRLADKDELRAALTKMEAEL